MSAEARPSHDSLGDRMKGYELAFRPVFPRRMPIILRVDGKAFHSYTRGLARPFDDKFSNAMDDVACALCANIDGAQLAYVQSDEISVLLHGYKRFASQPWFRNEQQKIVSVAASIAAAHMTAMSARIFDHIKYAYFDARAFVVPEADVCNYFLWRQQDATRNSIQMLARSLYSDSECFGRNISELQEMTWQRGHNWNDLPTWQRRGRCVRRVEMGVDGFDGLIARAESRKKLDAGCSPLLAMRHAWKADLEIPIFSQDRAYIEQHLALLPEEPTPAAAAGAPPAEGSSQGRPPPA